jgi:hypothetical protein
LRGSRRDQGRDDDELEQGSDERGFHAGAGESWNSWCSREFDKAIAQNVSVHTEDSAGFC